MGQPARLGFLPLFFAVEVFLGEFPDEALLAVLAVEIGAAALHAPLAHVNLELLAPEPLGKLGMLRTLHCQ